MTVTELAEVIDDVKEINDNLKKLDDKDVKRIRDIITGMCLSSKAKKECECHDQ